MHQSELKERTLAYWQLSRIWNGKGGPMTVGDMIAGIRNIISWKSDRISYLACELMGRVCEGRKRIKKLPTSNVVLLVLPNRRGKSSYADIKTVGLTDNKTSGRRANLIILDDVEFADDSEETRRKLQEYYATQFPNTKA